MSPSSSFIAELSNYYWHENDLSNITVALANSSMAFRAIMIKYFFPELDISEIEEIRREVPDAEGKGSRVDIYISLRNDPMPYLIEVKIWDANHHFGQYEEAYHIPSSRLGYIVNYHLSAPGYEIKTWSDFYKYIKSQVDKVPIDEIHLMEGYLDYLQNVCDIKLFEKTMNLSGIYSLYEFTNVSLMSLRHETDLYSCEPQKQSQPIRGGKILGLNVIEFLAHYHDRRRSPIYGWMSLYYDKEIPSLFIAIPERQNLSTHPGLFNNSTLKAGKTYSKPFEGFDEAWNMNCLWFQYKNLDQLDHCETIDEQQKLLSSYINEVIYFVATH